jgi:Asp-tRNA(Asn)/Glu-tRNA(Gln) amidotransferase A subunit family amidase
MDAPDLIVDASPRMYEFTPEQVRRARLVAAGFARDVEDCRTLLDVLGLLPEPEQQDEPEPKPVPAKKQPVQSGLEREILWGDVFPETREEKVEAARILHRDGLNKTRIATLLRVSGRTINRMLV